MRFALSRPCEHCPFRNDRGFPFFASGQRVEDILDGMEYRVFPCHKTTPFGDDGDQIVHGKSQACAGALIMMKRSGVFSVIVQILSRLGEMTTDNLDLNSPVYESPQECVTVHDKFGARVSGPLYAKRREDIDRRGKWWWPYV